MPNTLAFHLSPARAIDVTSTAASTSAAAAWPAVSPFTLGLPLWHVLTLLAHPALRAAFPRAAQTDLTFHTEDPVNQPILLQLNLATSHQALAAPTFELAFEGRSQRLQLITLHLPSQIPKSERENQDNGSSGVPPLELLYNSRVIHSLPHTALTRGSLHQHLGPTYAGKLRVPSDGLFESMIQLPSGGRSKNKMGGEFLLSYPGMAFGFDVPAETAAGEASTRVKGFTDVCESNGRKGFMCMAVLSFKTRAANGQSPTSIYIFRGSDPLSLETVSRPIAPPALEEKEKTAREAWHDGQSEGGGSMHNPYLDADTDADALGTGGVTCVDAEVQPGVGVTLHMQQSFITSQQARSSSSARAFHDQPLVTVLRLGVTTPQDAIAELGTPQKVHWKDDDRLQIHRAPDLRSRRPTVHNAAKPKILEPGSVSSVDEPALLDEGEGEALPSLLGAMFYNYFDLGIDLLFSAPPDPSAAHDDVHEEQRLLKIVLHSNVPGSALFQRYNRCPWSIAVGGRETGVELARGMEKMTVTKGQIAKKNVASSVSKGASTKKLSSSPRGTRDSAPSTPPVLPNAEASSGSVTSVPFYRDFAYLQSHLSRTSSLSTTSSSNTQREGGRSPQTSSSSSETLLHLDRASSPQGSLRGLLSPDSDSSSAQRSRSDVKGGNGGSSGKNANASHPDHALAQGAVRGLDVRTTLHGFEGLVVEEDRNGCVVGIMVV